ncbi:uncharacterized protein LOC126838608 [Adelges cooleyi]|uniref:uncharacterized protein LOC126838608 n=1 Tax=Adelges cooleyi TaxID=133065 RepID=UPI00217FD1AE|nr:uncharacterized protein LOC126838608 [Adelges cooleyi]
MINMFRVILALLSLTTAVTLAFPNKTTLQVHCAFSDHLLHFFKLSERLFQIEMGSNRDGKDVDKLKMENIEAYGEMLQTRGDIVMAMLDDLRRESYGKFATDLITVNLFLNNIVGNVNLYKIDDNGEQLQYNMVALKKGYTKIHELLIGELKRTRRTLNCRFVSIKIEKIQSLSPDNFKVNKQVDDPNEIRSKMQEMLDEANRVLSLPIQINTHVDFLPENMLMCDLIDGGQWSSDEDVVLPGSRLQRLAFQKPRTGDSATAAAATDDGLQAIRQVLFKANQNMPADHGVVDLFHAVKLNFNASIIKSYQQQVLAATVYPVFKCIKSYLDAFKQVYYTDKFADFGQIMKQYGQELRSVIAKFENLNIFPYAVIEYIGTVRFNLAAIVFYSKLLEQKNGSNPVDMITKSALKLNHPDWIPRLVSMCSAPMILNNIQFDTNNKFVESITDADCTNIMKSVKTEIGSIFDYVSSIKKNISMFQIVITTVLHDEMFTKKPLDVFKPSNIQGTFKMGNDDEHHVTASCTSFSFDDKNNSAHETIEN